MNTPRKGATIRKIVHSTFMPPPMSLRRKTSVRITMSIQIQMTHMKNTSMVHITSRNG